MTVRMVPSVGCPTARYASFVPERIALAISLESALSSPLKDFAIPRKNSDRMAPELPRAARRTFSATRPAASERVPGSTWISRTGFMVRLILMPVSPSGTGNTLRLLISVFWLSSELAAETHIF